MYTLHCFTLKAFTNVLNIITYIASVSIIWSFPTIYNKQWANMNLVKCGSKKHCSFGVSLFPTYIAQLLHILITVLGLLDLFLTLVQTMCSASNPPALHAKSLGIRGQRHAKAIRQKVSEVFFSGHWGESKRLQRSVTKTGRCCGSVLCSLQHWHTQTDSHAHTQT